MSNFRIILACSGKKADVESCPAKNLYRGEIFLKGQRLANVYEIPYWILSAKYGIIDPDDVIENYDQKLTKPYTGPFPPAPYYGFYVGGQSYFKNFPGQWLPLVPPAPIGKMLQSLKHLTHDAEEAKQILRNHPNHASV